MPVSSINGIMMPVHLNAIGGNLRRMSYDVEQRRRALSAFIERYKLKITPWAAASNVARNVVNNFLNRISETLTDASYEKLAAGANRLLKVDWVTAGVLRGDEIAPDTVAIVGKVGAGAQVLAFDDSIKGAGIGETERPPGITGRIVAVQVEGESMLPAYRDQDILFYTRDGADDWTRHVGDECVVQVTDGRVYVKVLRRGSKKGHATLSSYNAVDIEDVPLDWAAPILWVKRARRFNAGGRLPLTMPTHSR
jgi:phage repressor protein C with HTH and peptisase S24 domain